MIKVQYTKVTLTLMIRKTSISKKLKIFLESIIKRC